MQNSKKPGTILLVDDNPEMLALIGSVLELEDHRVIKAKSGKEALEILSEIAPPDLVLLDVRMENMSGHEFLEIFEKKMPGIFKKVPVVLVTGMDVIPVTRAVGVIKKPFEIHGFLTKIARFIELGSTPNFKLPDINH